MKKLLLIKIFALVAMTFIYNSILAIPGWMFYKQSVLDLSAGDIADENFGYKIVSDDECLISHQYLSPNIGDFTLPTSVIVKNKWPEKTYKVIGVAKYTGITISRSGVLTIPKSYTQIEEGAFACSGFYYVEPENKKYSNDQYGVLFDKDKKVLLAVPDIISYYYKHSINPYTIPNTVERIGDGAFYGVHLGSPFVIPSNVKSIGDYAFSHFRLTGEDENGKNNTVFFIPKNVKEIGEGAIAGLSCAYFSVDPANPNYTYENFGLYNKNKTELLGVKCWNENGQRIKGFTIPETVVKIGGGAFYSDYRGDYEITEIILPSKVTSIGDFAFYNFSNLQSIKLPEKLESIGVGSFVYCSNITSIELPKNLKYLGDYSFQNCEKLNTLVFKTSLIESIGNCAFQACDLREVTIPESVTEIGDMVFSWNVNLENINLPTNLNKLSRNIFHYCRSLKSISLPSRITYIGFQAFDQCSSLKEIEMPEGLETIENFAFRNCSSLESIVFPNSITKLGANLFDYCKSLVKVYNYIEDPAIGNMSRFFQFGGAPDVTVYVPNESKTKYITQDLYGKQVRYKAMRDIEIPVTGMTTVWLDYTAEIPENVLALNAYELSIEKNVVEIGFNNVDAVLPEKSGVLVKGDKGIYRFCEAENSMEPLNGYLVGSEKSELLGNDGYFYYDFGLNSESLGNAVAFYLVNEDGTLTTQPYKAYLQIPEELLQNKKYTYIELDQETGIKELTEGNDKNGKLFNLSGRNVGLDYKGIVIQNGKKILKK